MKATDGDRDVMRWGGLAGILGALLLLLVFVVVLVFVGPDPFDPEELVVRSPIVEAVRAVENSLYLAVLILWVLPFLALHQALQGTSPAPALFGGVLGVAGLVVLAAGALVHVATRPISDLYHAPGATPADRATLVLLWQATQGIFDALLVTGLAILPIALVLLGVAMVRAPAFGKGFGGTSVGLGGLGIIAAVVLLVDPTSPIAAVGVLGLLVFHLVVGWRLYSLSRVPGAG